MEHGDEQGAVPEGPVDAGVHGSLRQRRAVRAGAHGLALAAGLHLPGLRRRGAQLVSPWHAAVPAVLQLSLPVQPAQRHDLRGHQAAADALVSRHAPAHAGEEQRLGVGTHAPPRGVVPHRLAGQAQAHGDHAPARSGSPAQWPCRDRRRLPRRRAAGRQERAGLGEQDFFRGRGADYRGWPSGAGVPVAAALHQAGGGRTSWASRWRCP